MGNDVSAAGLMPHERYDGMLREFTHDGIGEFSNIFMRGGMTYCGSSILFRSLGMASGYATPIAIALTALEVAPDVIDLLRQTGRRIGGIPQHSLIEGLPGADKCPVIFNEKIRRRSQYRFRHRDERYTIVGIACIPLSKDVQSPEAEVVEGGLNHSYVCIRLTPEKEYAYGCQIIITGKEREPECRQSETEPNDEPQSSAVPKFAVNLQSFWADRPAVWFAQAEAQFELAAIMCQRTKFKYVVSQLNEQQADLVEDIIISPPDHEPYDRLKAELLRRLSASREQRTDARYRHQNSEMEPNDEPQSSAVPKFAVNLPPFWPDQPAIWFAQAEAQFELAAITCQRTKFNYMVLELNKQQAALVEDIITSPPEHEPYDWLKAELVRRLSTSREQRLTQLLSHEEMGDQKPLQFLRHLRGLAPDVTDDFLRPIWTSCLPPHVQAMLSGQTDCSLDSAAQLADEFCKVTTQSSTASSSPVTPDNTARLLERIEELSCQVAALRASPTHSRSQARYRDHLHSRDGCHINPMKSQTPYVVCWYHQHFGDKARKCTPPCSRQHENSTSRQ